MFKSIHSLFLEHKKHRRVYWLVGLLLAVVLILIMFRVWAEIRLRRETNQEAIAVVASLLAKPGPSTEEIILPGNVQAWHEATIYARTNGYLKKWYVDIGSRVKEGDLLAEIEAPEVHAQLRQAEADLKTAIANEELARITAKRWIHLLKSDSVSKQETDEKVSAAKALAAVVLSAKANRDHLQELVDFEQVLAPFDGVISSRTTDIGDLITAGSTTSDVALFQIVKSSPLRIYVQIPQTYSNRIKPEMAVSLRFSEHPGRSFPAQLFQTADAIDAQSRTLLAQFTTENKNGELLPGGYTEVHFQMPLSKKLIRLPVNTLLFRSQGLQVATVDKEQRVRLKNITISRDFGNQVEVSTGVMAGDRIILNPSDGLFNGQKVILAEPNRGQISHEK